MGAARGAGLRIAAVLGSSRGGGRPGRAVTRRLLRPRSWAAARLPPPPPPSPAMRVFVSSGRLPAAPTGLGARGRLPWGLRRAPARIHAGLDTMRVPGPCPGLGAGTPRATAGSCGSTSLRGRVARSGGGGGGGSAPAAARGCSARGERRATGVQVHPPRTGLTQRSPRATRAGPPGAPSRASWPGSVGPRAPPPPRPLPVPTPRPCSAPCPALGPPRAPPPARPGGGRSAGAERAHRGGGRSIRGADGPARRAWRRGAGRRGGAAGGRSGVSRAGGRAGGGRLCALTCSALSTGGPGCGRCGGASWTCSRPSSCCLGSALPRRSQVTPAGTRDPAQAARPPRFVRVPRGGSRQRRPPHLQPTSASAPGAAPARPTRAGGPRAQGGAGKRWGRCPPSRVSRAGHSFFGRGGSRLAGEPQDSGDALGWGGAAGRPRRGSHAW